MLLILLPLILLLVRNRPADSGLEPFRDEALYAAPVEARGGLSVKEALASKVFWQIGAIMFIIGFVTGGIHNHSVAYLTDIGHSPTRAAFYWSLVMMVMVAGKLLFGPAADRWGPSKAMAGAFVLYTLGILALLFARLNPFAITFAAFYGFAGGAPLTLNPMLTMGNLGMKNFGMLYGILVIIGSVGAAIGPVASGAVFDRSGSYIPIFVLFLFLTIAGIGCSLLIRPKIEAPHEAPAPHMEIR
jgi:MFS family permease